MLKTQFKKRIRKIGAILLAGAVCITNVDMPAIIAADEISDEAGEETENKDTIITPFEGQWKYYGQSKKLLEGEHYVLSKETDATGWTISLENEKVGNQKYILSGNVGDIKLPTPTAEEPLPTFEIKKYSVPDGTEATIDTSVVNIEYAAANENIIEIKAPEGYLISDKCTTDSTTTGGREEKTDSTESTENEEGTEPEDTEPASQSDEAADEPAQWADELTVSISDLEEGENTRTYYLRSNLTDLTRGAIDQTPKTIIISKDTISPTVTALDMLGQASDVTAEASLTGSESGSYYYMVLPTGAETPEEEGELAELIQGNVKAHMGIVGSGRMDAGKSVTLNITNLSSETEYQLFAIVLDKAGNESPVKSITFTTDKMSLKGTVNISGNAEVGSTLTAVPTWESADVGTVSYQWYRVRVAGDETELNKIYDLTGGNDSDMQDSDDGDEEDEDEEDEDEDDEAEGRMASVKNVSELARQGISIDDADPIENATASTYKVTKEDIGYRLMVSVSEETYSGNLTASTSTFVPKLIPSYQIPTVGKTTYSPQNSLSKIKLPSQWSWVDGSTVPVYENDGYRARFVPTDTKAYKTVIVRVKVPVSRREIKKSWVSVKENEAYTGKEIKDNFKIKDGKYKLVNGKDYQVTYFRNKNLGKATIKIKGEGNYKGSVKVTYQIVRKSVSKVNCQYTKTKVYTGKSRKIYVELKNNSIHLKEGRDYTITYKNNKEVGKATAWIKGKGNYKGTKKLSFSIVPAKPKIAAKKKGTGIRVTLSSKEKVKGYQVYISTSRTFQAKDTQQYLVTGKSFGIQDLKKGTYYVRAKAYDVKKGKTYASSYSKTRKVKIK